MSNDGMPYGRMYDEVPCRKLRKSLLQKTVIFLGIEQQVPGLVDGDKFLTILEFGVYSRNVRN